MKKLKTVPHNNVAESKFDSNKNDELNRTAYCHVSVNIDIIFILL